MLGALKVLRGATHTYTDIYGTVDLTRSQRVRRGIEFFRSAPDTRSPDSTIQELL